MTTRLFHVCVGAAALAFGAFAAPAATAAVIISPVAANHGGPGCCNASQIIDQSGLTHNFISGLADFDSFLSLDPRHLSLLGDLNILSIGSAGLISLHFDLGAEYEIDRLALWTKHAGLFSNVSVLGSLDGITYEHLHSFNPTGSVLDLLVAANVAVFAKTAVRHVRLDFTGCLTLLGLVNTCSIGEVVFGGFPKGEPPVNEVPIPAALPLFAAGLAGLGLVRRRKRLHA